MMANYDYVAYGVGLCYASVCTSLTDEEAAARLNLDQPTGVGRPWEISKDETFANGQPQPRPCDQFPDTHRHILFEV